MIQLKENLSCNSDGLYHLFMKGLTQNLNNKMKLYSLLPVVLLTGSMAACQQPGNVESKQDNKAYSYRTPTNDGIGKYYLNREIAHVMGAGASGWLERPERQKEENTDLAIRKMNLKPGMVVADIGAGSGYYTFRIAGLVPDGQVYAVDVQQQMVDLLQTKKRTTGAGNVEVIRGSVENTNLPAGKIDLAFMVDVYHELEFPKEILASIHKALKPDGKLLLIEYRGEDESIPIKPLHKMTVTQVNKEMLDNGFVPDSRGEFLPIQHFLVYRKKDS